MARGKRFVPDDVERRQVESMAGFGMPHEQIACLIREGIDADTLKKHFRKELQQGKAKASAKISQTLFQKAVGGDTASLIFWAKTQMGFKETSAVEHGNKPGESFKSESVTPEQLAEVVRSVRDEF